MQLTQSGYGFQNERHFHSQVEEVDPNGPRAYHGSAVVGFNIFIIGGFDGMDYFNSCRCFNALSKTWREIAPMNNRR